MDSDEEPFYDAEDGFDEEDDEGQELSQTASQHAAPTAVKPGEPASVPVTATESVSEPVSQEPFPLHRACWNGQVELVKRLTAGMTRDQLKAFDSQGNTPLHVASMRRQAGVVSALLEAGCSATSRNARGWIPLMEAAELGDRALALQLARAEVAQVKAAVKTKKSALLALLRTELPDFSLQLKWELGSSVPGVGALVRRYAPHDTYTLWKKGGLIRVDGSLMGIDKEASAVMPAWKRGHFSLLYDATGDKPRAVIVNHTDKTYLDVKAARKKMGASEGEGQVQAEGAALETEIDVLMASEVLQHKKLRSVDFRFKPVAGWLTKEVKEKVEGWNCKLYEAGGRLVAVSRYKMPYGLTPGMSYDDYLAATFDADPVVESPVNPLNPASFKDRGNNPAKAAAKLAVAAAHQRIAAAAAAAKDEQAARVAKAAAARAAAGGLRALAPRIDEDDPDSDDDAEDEEGELGFSGRVGGGGGKGRRRSARRKAAAAGGKGAKGEGNGSGAEGVAHVVASAEVGAPQPASGAESGAAAAAAAPAVAAAATAAVDLSEVDFAALAAQVAAEAEKARLARKEGEEEEEEEEGGSSCGTESDAAGDRVKAGGKSAGEGRGGGAAWGGAGDAQAGSGPSSGPATASSSGGGNGVRPTRGASEKGWRGWGFGSKKGVNAAGGSNGGGGGGTSAAAAAAAAGGTSGNSTGAAGGGTTGSSSAATAKKSRKITGRCWMAESFPLSLKQLLPLLEVVGTANKAFTKVARFMQKYGDLAMFPVKVQVPLILTVYMMLSFKQFKLLGGGQGRTAAPPDEFFSLPPGYTESTLEVSHAGGTAGKDSGTAAGTPGGADASASHDRQSKGAGGGDGANDTEGIKGSNGDDVGHSKGGSGALPSSN